MESEVEEADGLVTTRAQERKKTAKGVDQKREAENKEISQKGEGRAAEVHQPAYQWEPRIANSEAPQQVLQRILNVEVC